MSRRGLTLVEAITALLVMSVLYVGITSLMITSSRALNNVDLQTESDQSAVQAVNRIITEVREAKEVDVLAPNRFRVYYPLRRPNGHYDRFQVDYGHYLEYAQTDSAGNPALNGRYLWRRTESSAGHAVASNVKILRVSADTPHTLRVTLHTEKSDPRGRGATQLNARILYLRNN